MSETLSKVDKARIQLWTARDMSFVISRDRGIGTIPRYTKCEKPPYNQKNKKYLYRMEETSFHRPDSNPRAVCVKLGGKLRYIWRTDVFTEEEYEECKREERASAVGVFGTKSRRSLG